MEALSLSPVRVAAVLFRSMPPGGQAPRRELRIVGRLGLVCRAGRVEISEAQSPPEGDELRFLEESAGEVDFTLPPSRKAETRIAGQHLEGGTLFAFHGAPEGLAKLRLPLARPRLFVGARASAREVPWPLGGVTLDGADGALAMHWRARVPLEASDQVALVALGADERLGFAELLARTRGLDASFVQQRARVDVRVGQVELDAPIAVAAYAAPVARAPAVLEEDTASMGSAELLLDADVGASTAVLPAPPPAPAPIPLAPAPPRQSIGERISLDPGRHRPGPPPAAAPSPAVEPSEEEIVLERIFVAPGAGARARAGFPAIAKAPKRVQDEAAQDRRAVAAVARDAARTPIAGLAGALADAVRDHVLEPRLVVVTTVVDVLLDADAALGALISAAGPLAAERSQLAKALHAAASARAAVPAAFARPDRALATLRTELERHAPAGVIEALEDAAFERLLAARRLAEIPILGAPHVILRARETGAPVYVPAAAADTLPLQPSFRARILGEPRPRYDDREASPASLVAVAIFREVALAVSPVGAARDRL